ncbi:unnamed protein product [Medioppia subpectinata]|uniref:Uncharacterized protein n=1 Tax=Medioppia subpectinata TaxID=1979941 RepID=A0A7R9LHG6_9ACAR|nr:unnamed protein product [Medioppia subpectinata]CAG2118835.1 unnamed protein product [Medioppia subpectinata]
MGNCCFGESDDNYRHNLNDNNTSSGQQLASNQSNYKSVSREEVAAAAERRAAQQQSRGAKGVVNIKARSAELPENTNSGGLRWQVG